jgi:LPS-assembly protein
VARWNYDHSNDRTLEGIAGLEYSTCCWNLRVIGRRWIDNDALFFGIEDNNSGVFVQFELKGLGSILGGSVSSMLNNGIRGFQDRENGRF